MKQKLILFFKGMAMGAADVVPGVSGGTIAFITGIYQELIDSIKSVDAQAIQLLLKGKIKDCWKHINGNFHSRRFTDRREKTAQRDVIRPLTDC